MSSAGAAAGLTVREALDLPAFAKAQVVAGHEGLDRLVQWAHIIDMPEASYAWDRPGVLLLTAGFGLRDDEGEQAALIPKLAARDFAGLVLSTGYAFDAAPEVLRRTADAHAFPILETPADVLFIELTEAIFGHLVSRHYTLLQDSARFHSELTGLVLRGGGLDAVASTLAELLDRSVTIEDPALNVLATARRGAVDEARERSVSLGRATPETTERLIGAGLYERLLAEMGPVHVAPEPELGMAMERIVAPIIVDREIHGYIWVIAGDERLNDLDTMAITHGATVAALVILREQAVRKAEDARRGDLLEALVSGDADPAALAEQAHHLGVRLDGPLQALLVRGASRLGVDARFALDDVRLWLRRHGVPALAVWRDELLAVVLHGDSVGRGVELARRMAADLGHPARRLLVGVGQPEAPAAEAAGRLRASYEQASEALRVHDAMGLPGDVAAFAELGLLHWLYRLPPAARDANPYLWAVRELAEADAEHGTDLVETLEGYLDHGASLAAAAKALFVHRNTLLHRIDRVRERTGLDLRRADVRLQVHAALKCHRLHNR